MQDNVTDQKEDLQNEKIEDENNIIVDESDNADETENVDEDEFALCTFNKDDVYDESKIEQETEDEADELPKEENTRKNIDFSISEKAKKNILLCLLIVAVALAATYVGGAIFYNQKFFKGTTINGFDCSNMTVDEARTAIENGVNNYIYNLYERKNVVENIVGKDVDLKLETIGDLNEVKARQNKWNWPFAKQSKTQRVNADITLNEDTLYQKLMELQCVIDAKNEAKAATEMIIYDEDTHQFKINDNYNRSQTAFITMQPVENRFSIKRVSISRKGDVVNIERLFECVKNGMYGLYPDMNLDVENCYIDMAEESNLKSALDTMNKYISTNVTYTKGDEQYYLDGGSVHFWVSVNSDFVVSLDENGVAEYVRELAAKYNTIDSVRNFVTTNGVAITLDPGDYGWKVDVEQEAKELCEIIRNGETTERTPVFSRKGFSLGTSDLGNTYVEVSIKNQTMNFYKNGTIIVSSNCVTGNPYAGNGTHTGVWRLKYKERNTILVGDNYKTPVSYWMPFNGGEGLHDANWRGAFGGSIYLGGGSHGCVNLPPSVAARVYENIEVGTPIIIY